MCVTKDTTRWKDMKVIVDDKDFRKIVMNEDANHDE